MIAYYFFAALTFSSTLLAAFSADIYVAILALWLAGTSVGAIYLILDFETLAMIQWLSCTLIALGFVFFAVLFGEYRSSPSRSLGKRWGIPLISLVLGIGFSALSWFSASFSPLNEDRSAVGPETNAAEFSMSLVNQHGVSLTLLALMLFVTLIGAGIVARSTQANDGPMEGGNS